MKKLFLSILLAITIALPASAADWYLNTLTHDTATDVYLTYNAVDHMLAGTIETEIYDYGIGDRVAFADTFCVQIERRLLSDSYTLGEQLTIEQYTDPNLQYGADAGFFNFSQVAWLVKNYFSEVINATEKAAEKRAGLQVAIWKAIYGSALTFEENGNNEDVWDAYDKYYGSLGTNTYTGGDVKILHFIDSDPYFHESTQDLLYMVPEPASLMLLGFGLLSLCGMARRKS